MPQKDPSNWQAAVDLFMSLWPQIYAVGLATLVAFVRAIYDGGRPIKSVLEAVLCGCLTGALMPVLEYFGMSSNMAVPIGAAMAFMGVAWIRDRLDALYEILIGRRFK
ncbi:phage holin, lambda family [Vreelandella sp. GE22]